MSPEDLYRRLSALHSEQPANLLDRTAYDDNARRWVARAGALIAAAGDAVDIFSFNGSADHLGNATHDLNIARVLSVFHRTIANAELAAPADMQGAFIAVGAQFDAFQAMGKVLGSVRREALIVDPYMGLVFLTEYAKLAPEGVMLRVLGDGANVDKDVMHTGIERWSGQFGKSRPIEMRLTPRRALHDRLVVIDGEAVWSLTQSFEHLANRSPASVVRVAAEIAESKRQAYEELWGTAGRL